ncbi:MAG: HEPN domain-containing protein [bacterium]
MTGGIKEDIKENIAFAGERWAEGQNALARSRFGIAVSHVYYTCFYYLRALLLTKGTEYQTHKGVLIGFRKLFVKEGLAPAGMADFLEKLARDRIEADYKFAKFTAEDVAAFLKKAEGFIAFAEAYLKKAME